MNTFYYDVFADCFVTKKSEYAPPERYITYIRGSKNSIYVDTIVLKDGKQIDLAWDSKNRDKFKSDLANLLQKNGYTENDISYFKTRICPVDAFEKIRKERL